MLKKTIDVFRNIVFVIACIVLVVTIACMAFQIKADMVLSGSMEPEIQTGSLAFTNTKDKDIEVGDVIYYQTGSAQVAHRVIEITDEGYITKGDNNEFPDLNPVRPEQVVGTVFLWIPKLGYIIGWIKSTTGIIILATVAVAIILLSMLPARASREDVDESAEVSKESDATQKAE